MNDISPSELKRLFPGASKSTEARNVSSLAKTTHTIKRTIELEKMTVTPTTDEVKLNKTERAYHEYLKRLNLKWLGVQNLTVKLANDCRLTPDFGTLDENGILTLIDVKGFQREDALIKMKVAARMFPWIRFVIVKKDGHNWNHEEVKP